MIGTWFLAAWLAQAPSPVYFPANGAANVNPDTHLTITFSTKPEIGKSGTIRIYDAAGDRLVDTLDLAIPAGPTAGPGALAGRSPYTPTPYDYSRAKRATNADTVPGTPSGVAERTPPTYQLTIIGGFTDAFHFYPVIVNGNTATIYPHHDRLVYGHSYYVQIDPGVLTAGDGGFSGVSGARAWRFSTKARPPAAGAARLVVAADGSGDFSTVQGAFDFVPDASARRVTIFVKNGRYEEIVYFRNKTNVTLQGEDREKVQIVYANSEIFNPHPPNVATNEWPGTFPSRRAAFMADHSSGIHLENLTIRNLSRGQAEGLLITGERNILSRVSIYGSGDALQGNGPTYVTDSLIAGDGDTILGRGPVFFTNCEIQSRGPFTWTRNTDANHGNVFVKCRFTGTGDAPTVIARAPTNGGRSYPNAEVVLIDCTLEKISPIGWGDVGGDTTNVHYWEYNSRNADGSPVDASARHPVSKRLTTEKDAATIANYRNPAWVLGGWTPAPGR